ncbi:MAG: class II aldolase/adducin family protein [Myxococcales bacterium]|nr:class II aldolase/adducin family protein [Myxococcales bacterium]
MFRQPETALRRALLSFARLTYERHLLVGLDGNLSVKLGDAAVLCTRAGCHKGMLVDDDLVVIDRTGRKLRGRGEPTSEMAMHLACYDARPDVEAVVHAHPPTCVAFTVAGVSMAQCVLPEVVLTIGSIPTLEYQRTGTEALARLVGDAVHSHDAVMMDRHGAVCVGRDLLEAFCRLETMEHTAKVLLAARQLGQVRELPAHEAASLRALGLARYGGPPSALPGHCQSCSGCGRPSAEGLAKAAGFSVARITGGGSA